MNNRVIDISRASARLSINNGRLVIGMGEVKECVPVSHIKALIVSCPGVTYTHAVLAELADANIPFICCNTSHQATGLLLPLAGNSIQTERFRIQAELGVVARKKLWKEVVAAKIRGQSETLKRLGKPNPLKGMWARVKSGDTDNMEAQAARMYWPALFGKGFERRTDGCGINAMLNYGYAVIRAITGRSLVAAGLHPSLGLHHHNRYDAYCLASDMMEPFRPLVDMLVASHGPDADSELGPEEKTAVLHILEARFMAFNESRTLCDIIQRACESLCAAICGGRDGLWLPPLNPINE